MAPREQPPRGNYYRPNTSQSKFKKTSRSAREKQRERQYFKNMKRHEVIYARQLRQVAAAVHSIITGSFDPDNPLQVAQVTELLEKYAEFITPWAQSVGRRMVAEIANRDEKAWVALSKSMGRELTSEIKSTPLGQVFRQKMAEQVHLIRSIPLDAAKRVHELTIEAATGGKRASDLVAEIMNSGNVSKSKATLIARTEVARTSSKLIETRAQYVGSLGYIWRTVGDTDVRREHKVLNGKYFKWGEPPIAGPNGMRYHAGGGPNCRCYPEPVIID